MNDDLSIGVGIDYDGSGWKAAEADIGKFSTGVASVASSTAGAAQGLGAVDARALALASSAGASATALTGVGSAASGAGAGLQQASGSAGAAGTALDAVGTGGADAGAGLLEVSDAADDAAKGLEAVKSGSNAAGAGLDTTAAQTSRASGVLGLFGQNAAKSAADTKVFGVSVGDLAGKLGITGQAAGGAASGGMSGLLTKIVAMNPATLALVAGAALAVTGILALGNAAVNASAGFQAQMIQVQTLGADFGKPFEEVNDQVSDLATTMGIDATNAAKTLYNAVSAGVPPGNALEFMEAASKAAVGGAAELSAVGSAISVATNSWGSAVGGAIDVTDGLFQIIKSGVTTMPELATNLGQASGVAAAAGVSFEEYGAALALVTTKGKTTSVASTQLKQILADFMSPVSKAAVAFKEMGYSTSQAAIESLGFQGALAALGDKAAAAGQPITAMFGSVEAGAAALDLTGENTAKYTTFLEGMQNAGGNTEAALAMVNEGYLRQKELLGGEFQGILRDIGTAILPVLTAGFKAVLPVVSGLHQGVNGLLSILSTAGPIVSGVASGLGVMVGVVVDAVGGVFELIDAGAQLIGGWGNVAIIVGSVGAALAVAAAPITLVVAAVGALTFGIGDLNRATGEAQETLGAGAVSIADYGAAVDAAAAKSSLAAGAVSAVKDALGGSAGSIIRNADAWLQHNAGASEAVLASAEVRQAHKELNYALVQGKIDQDEYQTALLAAADAASFAAGEGHLLSGAQQELADKHAEGLSRLASYQGGISMAAQESESFRTKLAEVSAEQAQGKITSDEARASILAYADGIKSATVALDESATPAGQAAAAQSAFAQEFSTNTALILQAGDGLLLGEEERAEKFKQIGNDLNTGVADSLQSLWDTRLSYNEKFLEAQEQDAQAQASARQSVQAGQAQHNQKMADLQAKAAGGGDAGAQANAAIAEEQKKWNGILSVATGGTQAATAKVQEQYNAEREAIRESLAQTVIDHLNAMVMMGDVSAETARGIYGALSEAYPGVEAINPVTEATLEFSAAVGDAMQGGDPSAIVTAIDTVEQKMVEADSVNRESLGIAQQTWQGIGDQAAAGSTAVVAASGAAADETTTRSAQQTAAHLATAASHAQLAEDVEAAGQKQVKATSTAATGMADKLGGVRGELSATAASARGVGTEVDRSFSGLGERAAGGLQGVSQALDDVRGAMSETAQEANNMSAGQVEALIGSQDAGHEAASGIDDAMSDVGDSMDQAAERTGELKAAVEELPTDVAVEVTTPGADEAIRTIGRLLADIQKLKAVRLSIVADYTAKHPAVAQGGSFALEHWIEDARAAADSGPIMVTTDLSDGTNGLLTETDGSGSLAWKGALDELAAGDYPVVITAVLNLDEYNRIKAQFDTDIADTSGRLDEAARLASYWGQQLTGSWQGVSTLLREINADDLPAFIAGLALPEGIDTLDELIQHFESLSPDEQMDLWKRMFDDLKTLEGDFHKAWMDDAKKRDEEDSRLIESRIRRIEELRQQVEEEAKRTGNPGGEIEGLTDERQAAQAATKELLAALGFVGVSALEDFYEAFTLGARDGIHSSEELAEALKFLQEETKRLSSEQAALEAERHEAAVLRLEELGDLSARQFDEWKDAHAEELRLNKELADLVAKRTAELEKARLAAEKALEKELKDQAKDRADDEKTAHKLILDHISERKDAEKDASTARLSALDVLKTAEGKRHNTALDDIKERGELERDTLKSLENQLSDMKLRSQAAQLAQGGLDEAKRVLAELQKTISRLPKDNKRQRPGDSTSFTAASIGLSQDAITAALASDKLTAAARRRLILLQRGASLGIAQLRQTLDEAEAAVELSADAKLDEVDLLKRQIDQQEYLIAVEKRRLEGVDERLKLELDGENERHDLEMDNISKRRDAEQAAWDAYQRRFEDAKKAEDERSAAKLRSIENELRASLLAQGLEAGEDPEVAFRRAKAIADRFTEILDRLIGTSGPAAGSGGGLRVVDPGGLGAPGGINGLRGTGLLPAVGKIVQAGDVFAVAAEAIDVAAATFGDAVDESRKAARKSIRGDDDEAYWAGNKYGATGHSYAARQRYLREKAQAEEDAKPEWQAPPDHLTRPNMGTAYDPNAGSGEIGGIRIIGPGGPLGGLMDIDWAQTLGQPFAVTLSDMSVTASQYGVEIANGLMGPFDSAILQAIGHAELLRDTLSGIPALAGAGGGPVSIDRRTIFNGPVFIDRDLAEEIGLLDAARFIP